MSKLKCWSIFVFLPIIFNLQSVSTMGISTATNYECEPITTKYCAQIGYKSTIFPNILNHTTQEDAASELYKFTPLSFLECSADLPLFICSIYVPVCTILGRPIPPCKSLCLSVKRNCSKVMKLSGFDWPKEFDCSGFPELDWADGVLCLKKNSLMETSESNTNLKYDGTIIYSNQEDLDFLFVESTSLQLTPGPLISNPEYLTYASGLAVDYESARIIYGDYEKQTINSIFFNGTGHIVLAKDQGELKRIEFDPIKRVLYWVYQTTLFERSSIAYMRLTRQGAKGSNVRKLLKALPLAFITGIALDDCGRNIFWAQASTFVENAIFRTDLVHVQTRGIITTDIRRPCGLTIDHGMSHLYWSDKWLDIIERSDYDGRSRFVIARGENARSVYGMTVYGNHLYWVECDAKLLYKADKITGKDLIVVVNHLKAPVDVVAVVNNTNECVEMDHKVFLK